MVREYSNPDKYQRAATFLYKLGINIFLVSQHALTVQQREHQLNFGRFYGWKVDICPIFPYFFLLWHSSQTQKFSQVTLQVELGTLPRCNPMQLPPVFTRQQSDGRQRKQKVQTNRAKENKDGEREFVKQAAYKQWKTFGSDSICCS